MVDAGLDVPALQALLDGLVTKFEQETQVFLGFKNVERAALLRTLAKALPALLRDGERLDWLEAEAKADPLLLHNERPGVSISRTSGSFRGLGLLDGQRSLRNAIDAARSLSETPE